MKTFDTFFSKLPKGKTTDTEIRKIIKPLVKNTQFLAAVNIALKVYKPNLPNKEAHEHIKWLRRLYSGKSGVPRRDHPFTELEIEQLNDAVGVKVVAIQINELTSYAVYEINLSGNYPGFKFTRKEPNPIIP